MFIEALSGRGGRGGGGGGDRVKNKNKLAGYLIGVWIFV